MNFLDFWTFGLLDFCLFFNVSCSCTPCLQQLKRITSIKHLHRGNFAMINFLIFIYININFSTHIFKNQWIVALSHCRIVQFSSKKNGEKSSVYPMSRAWTLGTGRECGSLLVAPTHMHAAGVITSVDIAKYAAYNLLWGACLRLRGACLGKSTALFFVTSEFCEIICR